MATRSAPFWHLPWRYGLFLLVLLSIVPLAACIGLQSGIMAGFDIAALAFAATLHSVFAHDPAAMRRSARENDANRTLMLVMTAIVMAVMLVVIATELRQKATPSTALLILIISTLVLGWVFSNLIYTFHYAFLFYRDGGRGLSLIHI